MTSLLEFMTALAAMSQGGAIPVAKWPQHIVGCVAEALKIKGVAIYRHDDARHELVPAGLTPQCPPLIVLPGTASFATPQGQQAIRSFIRRQAVSAEDGLLGSVFTNQEIGTFADVGKHPDFAAVAIVGAAPGSGILAAVVVPLTLGARRLGVLAVARRGEGAAFSALEILGIQLMAAHAAAVLSGGIDHQAAVQRDRLEADIRRASDIQRLLLPAHPPVLAGWSLAASCQAATVVSGDYFDFIPMPEGRLGLVIADVSGKGLSAGLVMATCRSLLRASALNAVTPSAILAQVNRLIFSDIREDMFVSLALVILDPATGEIVLGRAGHDPPVWAHTEEARAEWLKSPGLALGVDPGNVFDRITRDQTYALSAGDVLVLYTDGLTEATARKTEEEYGPKRLEAALLGALAAHPRASARAIHDALLRDVHQFMAGAAQADDLTLVVLRRDAAPSA
jgi:phosphoserine phosphatase RsbU/P